MSFLCGLRRVRRSAVSKTGCSNEHLRYNVRFQVQNRTAHVCPDTVDSRLVCVLVVPRGVVACGRSTHGLPSHRAPSVPLVSLPGPTGCSDAQAGWHRRQNANPFVVVGVVVRVNVSWWSKQGQRDCTLLLLYVLLESFTFHLSRMI